MKQLGVTSAVVWGRFGTDPNHDKGEPDHGWVLWFPIRTSFICFVPELERVLFVCSKAGTSKMRPHDACLVRIKTNCLIAYLLCVLGLCGPIRNLSILPHRALTVRD
jgi:hypothetical protein